MEGEKKLNATPLYDRSKVPIGIFATNEGKVQKVFFPAWEWGAIFVFPLKRFSVQLYIENFYFYQAE